MSSWRWAQGVNHAVFYNQDTDVYLDFEYKNENWFAFSNGSGLPSKRATYRLDFLSHSLSSESMQLLSQLKAGTGQKPRPGSAFRGWETLLVGPLIALRKTETTPLSNAEFPEDRIVLTMGGFIYFCYGGAMHVTQLYESHISIARATALRDLAISNFERAEHAARVDSLKVWHRSL
jgi:hypothetical protein